MSFCARGPLATSSKTPRNLELGDGVVGVGGMVRMSKCRGGEVGPISSGEGRPNSSGSEAELKDATSHGRRKGAAELARPCSPNLVSGDLALGGALSLSWRLSRLS